MRYGVAIDLHADATNAADVTWQHLRDQALAAERAGLDIVVLPDHLAYRAGGEGDYALPDRSVGARESFVVAAAMAATTTAIDIGHSMVNAPYRTPAMLAHLAATVTEVAAGRYSLGIGVGNSFDYDQLGVAADHRVARFEECVEVVWDMLTTGGVDIGGEHVSAPHAELVLKPDPELRPAIVVAAGGPRTMRTAVRFGDAWNGWCPSDPVSTVPADLLRLLDQTCEQLGRDPAGIGRTFDVAVDPLDLRDGRGRSLEVLGRLAELGADEVRCYPHSAGTHEARMDAIEALAGLAREV
jgi:alkanesulfonate monooxygenase SsuD/methylene tetrahydromethanopterin reductase-like flavin-dependent oxidoreductase (luciferase family)